jgi:alkylhydroperoxidase family enzyme
MAFPRSKPPKVKPRLPILRDDQIGPDARAIIKDWPYALHRTLANSPRTLPKWMTFALHILRGNTLPEWDREIAILRVAWNCRSHYEWGMHERLARSIGFSDEHLDAVVIGSKHKIWKKREAALIAAVDEMQTGWTISDETWKILRKAYRPDQLVDLVLVVAEFILVALTLNAFRIPQEADVVGLPILPKKRRK